MVPCWCLSAAARIAKLQTPCAFWLYMQRWAHYAAECTMTSWSSCESQRLLSLQTLPFKATTSEEGQHHLADAAWLVMQSGTLAIGRILVLVLDADMAARAAVLRVGSWNAAAQRIRSV